MNRHGVIGRARATASIAIAVSLIFVCAPARAANAAIQPGARITRPDIEPAVNALPYNFYRCTLTFIFRGDSGALYTGTTGESQCVQKLGARAYDSNGVAFGTAVFQEYDANTPSDSFTLIAIDPSRYADVDPSVLGWGGPTGVVTTPAQGDPLLFTGNGFAEGDTPVTQERAGVLQSYDDSRFVADTLAELGDSGAPVIDAHTGAAIGMISDFGTGDSPPATDDGPSIARILHDCAAHGFDLTLVTAAFTSPLP